MEKDFIVKIHKTYRWVLAVCDKELKGKKFLEENKQLDLSGKFFDGDLVNLEELKDIIEKSIREDATFFIVGKKSVNLFKDMDIVSEEGVKSINGVDFALVLL